MRPAPWAAPLGEPDADPVRVLVHDPSGTAAFDRLAAVPEEELERRTLFRALPDRGAFAAHHAALAAALRDAGAAVVRLGDALAGTGEATELDRNPNCVYTRDAAVTLPWLPGRFVRGSMRKPVRRGEPAALAAALRALGLEQLFAAPEGSFLEGGDVVPIVRDGRRSLLVGHGPRTSRAGVDLLCERLLPWAADEVVAVRLPPWRMNLDGVVVAAADDVVVAHPGSIEGASLVDERGERPVDVLALLRASGMRVVEVTEEESMRLQACNCACLGGRRVVCYDLAPRVLAELARNGVDVRVIPGGELIKGTGGPRCMTRPLYC